MGVKKTLARIKENFYWESLAADVADFVKECLICQQVKYVPRKLGGLLQPIPCPQQVWEDLSMDFVYGLPTSEGNSVILVVVDRFSKGAHFGSLSGSYTAFKVARLFVFLVTKLHGMPRSIISDRDPIFVSKFWQKLFKACGTRIRMSTAYHPESDGQTEVVNRTLQQYLHAFAHDKPSAWHSLLPWAEWCYNTLVHSGTGFIPFEVIYGRAPPAIPDYLPGGSSIEAVDHWLTSRYEMLTELRRNLMKAQARMKKVADSKRKDVEF